MPGLTPTDTPLTQFKLLSFDIYGTLIDWESGIYTSLTESAPFQSLPANHPYKDRTTLLKAHERAETDIQSAQPDLEYSLLLAEVYKRLCKEDKDLSSAASSDEINSAATQHGGSVKNWPAFPDTVAALHKLHKHYKYLVPLTNSSPSTFGTSLSNHLDAFPFAAIYTAHSIGSYKPDPANFDYLIDHVKGDFGVEKDQILHVAQSRFHDHVPAGKKGLLRCWVDRKGVMGDGAKAEAAWEWQVDSLGELAELVEKAFGGEQKA